MRNRRYKTKNKTVNVTKEKYLANWREYYRQHREYHLERNRRYYLERMFEWYKWFAEIGCDKCEQCGFDKHPKAIDFHHINPDEKEFGIGKFINGRQCNDENKQIVKREIDKCMCLCANCHRIQHFVEINEHTDL